MPASNSIFISYRRSDSNDVTGRIYDRLREHFGREVVFKDVFSIPYGDDYRVRLEKTVGYCQVLIAVIGTTWLEVLKERLEQPQDWVRAEVEMALSRGIPVIPLLVSGASVPREDELPGDLKALASRNAAKASADPYFDYEMNELLIPRLEEIVGSPQSGAGAGQVNSSRELPTFEQIKLEALEKRKEVVIRKYKAAFNQYNGLLSEADKVTIEEQIRMIEQELLKVDHEINALL